MNALTHNDLQRRATPPPQRIKREIDALLREIFDLPAGDHPSLTVSRRGAGDEKRTALTLALSRRARGHEKTGPHPDPLPAGEGT